MHSEVTLYLMDSTDLGERVLKIMNKNKSGIGHDNLDLCCSSTLPFLVLCTSIKKLHQLKLRIINYSKKGSSLFINLINGQVLGSIATKCDIWMFLLV